MPRRPRVPAAVALAAAAVLGTASSARAHDEWNNLHIASNSRAEYVYPFDGRSPKISAAILHHHAAIAPAVVFTLNIDGQPAPPAFTLLPDGASLILGPDSFHLAATQAAPIFDGRFGPAIAAGASRDVRFDFVFRLAPGATPPPGQPHAPAATYVQTIPVRFTNLGNTPTLTGPMPLAGSFLLPTPGSPTQPTLRAEISTPYSDWFPLELSPSTPPFPVVSPDGPTSVLATSLPARADWHLRLTAPAFGTQVIPLGHPNDPRPALDLVLPRAPAPEFSYRRIASLNTSTAPHRAAFSEAERTFVVFPGQQTWPAAAAPDAAVARTLRSSGRIVKYRFDGTPLWSHAPDWETWAGDMTPDGRWIAYALNPTATAFHAPAELKLVLLDGTTGAVLWTKAAAPDSALGRQIAALELALAPDASVIAVGSVATGTVTLFDRATGNVRWTTPAGAAAFGPVRRLRFSGDAQSIYCGSADGHIRKLRVSDGAVLWKTFAGGWPHVNGLDLTPDGTWLVAGTQSLDATVIRTSDGFTQWQRETQFADATFAPDGRHLVTSGGQVYRTIDGALVGMTKSPGVYRFSPDSRYLVELSTGFRLFDLGGKLLAPAPAVVENFSAHSSHLSADGRYAFTLSHDFATPNQPGILIFERTAPMVGQAGAHPEVTSSPLSQIVAHSATATLVAEATGASPLAFQWRKNSVLIPGARSATLALVRATTADAATYDCIVSNTNGSVTTRAATIGVAAPLASDPPRLTNLAVRTIVGSEPLIVGFALGGDNAAGAKSLLVRGLGPSLTRGAFPGDVIQDPRLDVYSGPTPVLSNDNWDNAPALADLATRFGAAPLLPNSRDAALAVTAVPGTYTVQLSQAAPNPLIPRGSALLEIFDTSSAFTATSARLVNLSARAPAGRDLDLIAGFVVTGSAAKQVLIRAIGPTLAAFRVPTPMPDPRLTLVRHEGSASSVVATNDHWHDAPNAVALAEATQRVTFPLSPNSADAALLLSLPPGAYTAQATSSGAGGNVLIEIYDVPE